MVAGEVPGLWNLGKSYMSLDTDGRVVRLDSFAKFLAPGFRLGWLTAHPHFVDKFTFHMHGTALGPCSTTQVIAPVTNTDCIDSNEITSALQSKRAQSHHRTESSAFQSAAGEGL